MQTVKEINKNMIIKEINKSLNSGKYRDLNDILRQNPTLDQFYLNHKLNYLMHSFQSQFTNEDYIALIKNFNKENTLNNNTDEIKVTNVKSDDVNINFVDNTKTGETLEGVDDELALNSYNQDAFTHEKNYEKKESTFKKISEIDTNRLTKEQLNIYSAILGEPDPSIYEINFDELGNMTNIIRDNNLNYYTVEIKDGIVNFINHSNNQKKETQNKVKVLTKKQNNKSAAFVNTLILSFIIGSFFGVVFLAIYSKIMQ